MNKEFIKIFLNIFLLLRNKGMSSKKNCSLREQCAKKLLKISSNSELNATEQALFEATCSQIKVNSLINIFLSLSILELEQQ
jgi:hypothetical protein